MNKSMSEVTEELMNKHAKQILMLIEVSKSVGVNTQELACKAGISLFLNDFMETMKNKMANQN